MTLVVEDLHWADHSTRTLLAFLARNLRRERVLLVVTYRNDEADSDQLRSYLAEVDRSARVERLELARLDRAETASRLTGILGGAPPADLLEGVFAHSESNPFFTEELLESVRLGSGALPATLRDLLKGRVEALDERALRVLRVAAVAGRQVSHPPLAIVAGLDGRQLDIALRAAVAHRLLVIQPGGDGYRFRHALIQDTVYDDLLPGERARLHARYANALAAHLIRLRARRWWQLPSWPSIGMRPVNPPVRCRPGWKPAWPPPAPAPLPRRHTTTSVRSNCGSGCPNRAGLRRWTGLTC